MKKNYTVLTFGSFAANNTKEMYFINVTISQVIQQNTYSKTLSS